MYQHFSGPAMPSTTPLLPVSSKLSTLYTTRSRWLICVWGVLHYAMFPVGFILSYNGSFRWMAVLVAVVIVIGCVLEYYLFREACNDQPGNALSKCFSGYISGYSGLKGNRRRNIEKKFIDTPYSIMGVDVDVPLLLLGGLLVPIMVSLCWTGWHRAGAVVGAPLGLAMAWVVRKASGQESSHRVCVPNWLGLLAMNTFTMPDLLLTGGLVVIALRLLGMLVVVGLPFRS